MASSNGPPLAGPLSVADSPRDEPTGALDYQTGKEILKLIETVNPEIWQHRVGTMVTHNDAIRRRQPVKFRDGVVRKAYRNETPLDAEELEW